jgi:hypothetical protein
VAIRKEIDIKTDDNAKLTKSNRRALEAQNKTHGNGKRAKTHHASKGLFVKRASNIKWFHSYTDVKVVKDDLSYREDVLVYRPYRPVFPQPRSLVHHKLRIT